MRHCTVPQSPHPSKLGLTRIPAVPSPLPSGFPSALNQAAALRLDTPSRRWLVVLFLQVSFETAEVTPFGRLHETFRHTLEPLPLGPDMFGFGFGDFLIRGCRRDHP